MSTGSATGTLIQAGTYGRTRRYLRREVARKVDDLLWSSRVTATSTDYGQLVDTTFPKNLVVDSGWVNFNRAQITYESRYASYDAENSKVFVSSDFGAYPHIGDEFDILREQKALYDNAIDLAIDEARYKFLRNKLDETLLLVADTYEYTLPQGIDFIHTIRMDKDGDERYEDTIPDRHWELVLGRKIQFNPSVISRYAGRYVRFSVQYAHPQLNDDYSLCEIPESFLIPRAISEVLLTKESASPKEGRRSIIWLYNNKADRTFERLSTNILAGSRKVL